MSFLQFIFSIDCSPYVSNQMTNQSRKDLRRYPGFNLLTLTLNENSNYWPESLLEVIAG